MGYPATTGDHDQEAMIGRSYRLHPYGVYHVTGIKDADNMTLISPEGVDTSLPNYCVAWSLEQFEVRTATAYTKQG